MLHTGCGSPCYAAPEMIKGQPYDGLKSNLGLLVDIWSLGIILYSILVGQLPFQEADTQKLYRKILAGLGQLPITMSHEA